MRAAIILASLATLALSVASCKKYEEGPMVSFWPRKERIANKWQFTSVTINAKDTTRIFNDHVVEYTDKGTAIYQIGNKKYFGSWQLNNGGTDLDVSYDSLGRMSYTILMLKEKVLKYREKNSNWEYKLEPI
ncbi:MAG: hypothetical protein KJS92_01640 [Bacteroidetes bacterium]|nr:hypothetical protein [Bacteroidota bacterium]